MLPRRLPPPGVKARDRVEVFLPVEGVDRDLLRLADALGEQRRRLGELTDATRLRDGAGHVHEEQRVLNDRDLGVEDRLLRLELRDDVAVFVDLELLGRHARRDRRASCAIDDGGSRRQRRSTACARLASTRRQAARRSRTAIRRRATTRGRQDSDEAHAWRDTLLTRPSAARARMRDREAALLVGADLDADFFDGATIALCARAPLRAR